MNRYSTIKYKDTIAFGEEAMYIDKRYCHNGMENQSQVRDGYDYGLTRQNRNESYRIDVVQIRNTLSLEYSVCSNKRYRNDF